MAEAEAESGSIITDIPDDIFVKVLSSLSSKEAFCASLIAPKWKSLFTMVRNLLFHYASHTPLQDKSNFMSFIDKTFFLNTSPNIDTFTLICNEEGLDFSRMKGWLCAALWRRVESVKIEAEFRHTNMLHLDTFSGKTIVKLELGYGFYIVVPINLSLPNLKTLTLDSVQITDQDSADRLFSCSPVLEELKIFLHLEKYEINGLWGQIPILRVSSSTLKTLTLYNTPGNQPLQLLLNTPNIFRLDYTDHVAEEYNLPSPVEAKIDIDCFEVTPGVCLSLNELFQRISKATFLHLSASTLETIQISNILTPQLELTNLKFEIDVRQFPLRIFESCPQMETLTFEILPPEEESAAYIWLASEEVPECVSSQLKWMHIKNFKGEENELQIVEFFLKNAKVLEKLTIKFGVGIENPFQVCQNLLMFRRGSNECQVVII